MLAFSFLINLVTTRQVKKYNDLLITTSKTKNDNLSI